MLQAINLAVNVGEKEILKGLTLNISDGTVHALMGPNGSGKSTLAQTIMGHPNYSVTGGTVVFDGDSILELSPDKRALKGIFLSFQYPSEIDGVTVSNFLRLIYNKTHEVALSPAVFRKTLLEKMRILGMDEEFMHRYLNQGFSGGEKKRMEILQMLLLEPKLVILDEVDSGLDVDALRFVSEAVNHLHREKGTTVLLITHYTRILKYVVPDYVHIIQNGVITKTGGKELAVELEEKGYAPFGE